jgi:hypothetical protein
MSELLPYTFMDELYDMEGVTDMEKKTELLRRYCKLVVGAAESGKINWHQAAYEITATFRFDLDDVPGYSELFEVVGGDADIYGPTHEEIEKIKKLVAQL